MEQLLLLDSQVGVLVGLGEKLRYRDSKGPANALNGVQGQVGLLFGHFG